MKYTDKMEFKDGKAVVLYPGAGFHVAPIAEMGEQLLVKHNLKEVEFVYTEIGGLPKLRDLERTLYGLIQKKEGWSTGSSYKVGHEEISTQSPGGAFEQVFEIKTPHGLITIKYKNALSGENYFLDKDLQRSNFVIIHDIFEPHDGVFLGEFITGLMLQKKDKSNFLVISEDFTRPKVRSGWLPILQEGEIIAKTDYPYGCTGETLFEPRVVIPSEDPRITPIDVGKMGLINPNVLDLNRCYGIKVSPNNQKVVVSTNIFGGGDIKSIKPSLYLKRKGPLPGKKKSKLDDEFKVAEKILFPKLLAYLGITGMGKEELDFKIGGAINGFYVKSFKVPPQLYDPRLFKVVTTDTVLSTENIPHEVKKPGWGGAVIVRPTLEDDSLF